jgi:hypothetical protein
MHEKINKVIRSHSDSRTITTKVSLTNKVLKNENFYTEILYPWLFATTKSDKGREGIFSL